MTNTQEIIRSYPARAKALLAEAKKKILVLDGATGTALQGMNLTAQDFGGEAWEGCNEYLALTRPDVVRVVHEKYLAAGCDIIETNTFGSTQMVLDEYDLGSRAYEITLKATEIARLAAADWTLKNPKKPRFVAGAIGPTTKAISVTGGTSFENLVNNFREQARALIEGGSDYLLIETAQDSRNIKAAVLGIEQLEKEHQQAGLLPKSEQYLIAISGTIETMGTLLAGQSIEALLVSVMHRELFYIGLNCATGPEFMTDHLRSLSEISPFPVACVPNAGLPDEEGIYLETPEMMSNVISHFISQGWINFVGGCCGTHEGHISAFSKLVEGKPPRQAKDLHKSMLSGIEFLEITEEMRPVIVGERTNVIGSKKFRDLITSQKFEEAAEVARAQVKSGAHIVDICLSNPDRVEYDDLKLFLEKVIRVVKVPLMIDSTDEKCIEMALTYCQGKSIINSINLEDGEERFEKVVPLARSYGAALVVGTIDEDPEKGMATTRERKLEIAKRSYDLLVNKYGVRPEDIYFDPLVFPCATGDVNYLGSAKETIEGVRLIKKYFPFCKTVLGVSNVSFGLPPAGREVLNSVFLHHCVQAGLDLAIVNSEKLERFASLSPTDIELSNNLLFNTKTETAPDPVQAFVANFRERKTKVHTDRSLVPLAERLSQNIIQGSKDGLIEDLELARKDSAPLDIINGPLMKGMDEVGRLFNENKLIVAEVLQSAEVMKAAVAHLEQFMEKTEASLRGTLLLATVKGDVHDIGKNLVDIIFSNNGYRVINLGIKIPPETIIEKAKELKPDLIGLSGLLVKSALQMVVTAEDLARAGIQIPILVGGAALSRNFTEKKILTAYPGMVLYAQDAMSGLELANQVMNSEERKTLEQALAEKRTALLANGSQESGQQGRKKDVASKGRSQVSHLQEVPSAPDFNRHILTSTPVEQIWKYINPLMLYNRHLGLKAGSAKLIGGLPGDSSLQAQLRANDPKAYEIWQNVEEVKETFRKLLHPKAVYQFFKAKSLDDSLFLANENQKVLAQFVFPRQASTPSLCLSDYVSAKEFQDNVCLFVVTAGEGVRDFYQELKAKGEYLKSHIIQALALETAEAYAEWLHGFIRAQWGFQDSPDLTMLERFQAKYRGKRYSFGYPACPRLDDQKPLFDLLKPEDINVQLTEGFMMEPEASVSAIVFHHPEAQYFSVGNQLEANT